jgi:hypothetical protein
MSAHARHATRQSRVGACAEAFEHGGVVGVRSRLRLALLLYTQLRHFLVFFQPRFKVLAETIMDEFRFLRTRVSASTARHQPHRWIVGVRYGEFLKRFVGVFGKISRRVNCLASVIDGRGEYHGPDFAEAAQTN